ncbi:DUF6252 family protein [Winogradskyella sp. PG-2]|uniref:DUF6252 family protein n=1 Tax=Winogradskyella sp. PG-2 TaxID=754409 RepID=UPI000458620A|nr:DUF6252 family protein [Winogradskyella sp. PG-2]BAO75927.1 hypothetical protein WPG_1697 [Winogradskyella sp. PG-2]
MKKLILLSLVFFTIFSCGDEVQFNTPAFQGDRANQLWRAKAFSASIEANGFLTITGTNNIETVNLRVPSVIEGRYRVGNVNAMEAEYVDAFGTVYSTNNRPDPTVSVYPEIGEINIDEIDLVNKTFTGTFRFLAFDASGLNSVGYTNGIFYRVPLTSGEIPADPITCIDTEIDTETALLAYEASFASSLEFIVSADYRAACEAYAAALNNQRNYCGDLDGSIQAIIDGLGNCDLTCDQAIANRVEAESQYTAATIGDFNDKCAQYLFYLQEEIQFCGDVDGSIQTKIDGLDCGDDDGDGVPNAFEDFNGDGDLTNDDTDGDGTPNYLDTDDDGDGVLTADEAVDVDGNPIDTDGDLDVDYLDNDDDGDGLLSNFETGDTDGDGVADYLDDDDDGDTILTISENADPNADGNPVDAIDTDADGTPDYLQA